MAGSVGYYFNEIVELSARQNVSFLDPGEGIPEAWNGVTRVALDLHAPFDVFVPYAGANFGYVYGDSVKETFVAGPEAGVKVYLKEDVFVQGGAEYQFYFDDDDEIDEAFEDGQFLYNLAFGLRF